MQTVLPSPLSYHGHRTHETLEDKPSWGEEERIYIHAHDIWLYRSVSHDDGIV